MSVGVPKLGTFSRVGAGSTYRLICQPNLRHFLLSVVGLAALALFGARTGHKETKQCETDGSKLNVIIPVITT
jgi:hypothetical protein